MFGYIYLYVCIYDWIGILINVYMYTHKMYVYIYNWIHAYITHRHRGQYGASQRKMRVRGGGSG